MGLVSINNLILFFPLHGFTGFHWSKTKIFSHYCKSSLRNYKIPFMVNVLVLTKRKCMLSSFQFLFYVVNQTSSVSIAPPCGLVKFTRGKRYSRCPWRCLVNHKKGLQQTRILTKTADKPVHILYLPLIKTR